MYRIKQLPEDFVVKEINNIRFLDKGEYLYAVMEKRNYTTLRAIAQIASALNISEKLIGFSGTKDKNALTEQLISIKGCSRQRIERLELKDIRLKFKGFGNEKLFLGKHQGNEFMITVRGLDNADIKAFHKNYDIIKKDDFLVPNYFGEQRFSANNDIVGRAIVQGKLDDAVKIIIDGDRDNGPLLKEHLEKHPNDYSGALLKLKGLKMYVHAFQSRIWNDCIGEYAKHGIKDGFPVIGFGSELGGIKAEIADKELKKHGVSLRDFIIRKIPKLSSEGAEREVFMEVKDFSYSIADDDLNAGKKKIVLTFSLGKGSYATEVVRQMFG